MEDELICIHCKGRTVPSLWGGQRMLTQGNRGSFCPTCFCLKAPGLLDASTLSFHPVCLTSLLCMYPCLSLKKITSEQLFQRGQILFGPSSPGSRSTSNRVSCLWPSLQIPSSPTHFYRLTLALLFTTTPLISYREPNSGSSQHRQKRIGFVRQTTLPGV